MTAIFLYGTLLYPPLRDAVLGQDCAVRPATLADHAVFWAGTESYPRIARAEGASIEGVLVEGEEAVARLDYFEGGFGYGLTPVSVACDGAMRAARVYWPGPVVPAPGAPWLLADWVARWGPMSAHVAREAMASFGAISAAELAARMPAMRMRAYSRALAESGPAPEPLAPLPDQGVEVLEARHPYTKFFSVAEYDLRHRQFDGAMSPVVNRAAFLAADAVVVLPYDPVRDRVHLIEQFRMGPFFRGDPNRFLIEAVAGRVDPGETPEETARREAREEAGLTLGALHEVARCYPSPGALTEYLYIYVGEADLPDGAAGLGGLASEAEDIRSHILSFAAFEARLDAGGFNVGPLQIAALWLARHRDRLRAQG